MKTLLIDDDESARIILRQLCKYNSHIEIIEEFSNAIQAIKYLNKNRGIDLIFLDIHMPDFTGFDFLDTIQEPPHIIITTSDDASAFNAFNYDCIVDFLKKPLQKERFNKGVDKVLKRYQQKEQKEDTITSSTLVSYDTSQELYVSVNRRLVKIRIEQIAFIQAKGDYIKIQTQTQHYIVHSTLKKIQQKLPENTFLQVHRSYIINVTQIVDIEDNSAVIAKQVIPISKTKKEHLMKRLNLL